MEQISRPPEQPAQPGAQPGWTEGTAATIPYGSREAPVLLVPGGVALAVAWLLLSGLLSGFMCLLLLVAPPDASDSPPPPQWMEWLRFAGYAWIAMVSTGLVVAHGWRGSRLWAATCAFLFVQSAALMASCILNGLSVVLAPNGIRDYLAGYGSGFAVLALLRPLTATLVTLLFFRVRDWYGVPPRRGWRTMWFSGGWMLLLTALIFGANQVAQYRYFH